MGIALPGAWASFFGEQIAGTDVLTLDQDGDGEDPDEEDDEEEDEEKGEDDEGEGEGEEEEDEEEDEDEDEEEATVLVTIEFLTTIEWRRGQDVPDEVMAFDGRRVKIAGYMAVGTLLGADTFELVPQSCECGRSKLNHFVHVEIGEGGASFDPGRRQFEGTLSIGEEEDEDGFVTSLYRLSVDTFDPQEPEDKSVSPGSEPR